MQSDACPYRWSRFELAVIWFITVVMPGGGFVFGVLSADAGICGGDGGTATAAPGSLGASYCGTFMGWRHDVPGSGVLAVAFGPLILAAILGVATGSRVLL